MVRNTLTLHDNFHKFTPYAVGFDRMLDNLTRYVDNNSQSTGFPHYNIRKEGDNYVIQIALACFGKDDIEVEISEQTLSVRSDKKDEDADNLYRGISYRKFDRKFTLAEDIVVNGAKLENGMLTIDLERIVPEEKKPRLIEVK